MLPAGFAVRLSGRTHRCDDGRTLVGGAAGGVMYLNPVAAARLAADGTVVAADPVGATLARRLLDSGFADPVLAPSPTAAAARSLAQVTVVVPVRDRPDQLATLLGALPRGVIVVVVDDASRAPGPVAEVARAHGARLVSHAANQGPAAARNTGLAVVTTPYVAFCDSDVVPGPATFALLLAHLDDPAVAVVAPRVLGTQPRPDDTWIDRYEHSRSSLDLGKAAAAVRPRGAVSYVPSAFLLARVAALGEGFDASMRVAEDVDLVWRLVAGGWRVRYAPEATVRHRHRTRVGPWLARKAFYGTGAAILERRHGTAVAPLVLTPWSSALCLALLAQHRWSLPVAAAAAAVTTIGVSRRLQRSDAPLRTAAVLTGSGTLAAVQQTSSSLTRHHWPLAVLAATVSHRARRALLVAAVLDGLVDHHRTRPDLDPVRYVVARRLDDAAYGAGLWWGALQQRSPGALLPELRGFRRSRGA